MRRVNNRKQSMHYWRPLHYEWEALRSKKLQEVVEMCREDQQLSNHKQFFCNLNDSVLQLMLRTVFTYRERGNDKERFKILELISMLKSSNGFIDFLASGKTNGLMTILGILDEEPDPTALNIFQEVFVSLARVEPNKLIRIIKGEEVQAFMIRNMRHRQMYKVIYTTIFCLNYTTSKQEMEFVSLVICSLLLTLFEDQNENNFFDAKHWPKLHQQPEHVSYNSQICPQTVLSDQSYTQQLCCKVQSPGYFASKDQSSENIVEMFQQLSKNVDYIEYWNFEMLFDIMLGQKYIPKLFSFLEMHRRSVLHLISRKSKGIECYEASFIEFEENTFQLIYHIIELYRSLQPSEAIKRATPPEKSSDQLLGSMEDLFKDKNTHILPPKRSLQTMEGLEAIPIKTKREKSNIRSRIKQKFMQILGEIATNMFCLSILDLRRTQTYSSQTSGLVVKCAGFKRFWILKIYFQLLNSGETLDIGAQETETIINFLVDCLDANKWNNIIQNMVVELFRLVIDNFYQLLLTVNVNKGISQNLLGHLVINFRNRYHVFLKTMNMSHQGNRHTLFQISKHLINKMSQQGDLEAMKNLHPEWKQFVEHDIKKYETVLNRDSIFSRQSLLVDQELREAGSATDNEDGGTLGAIQQLVDSTELDQRWNLNTSALKPKRKQSLADASLWNFDSLKRL